MPQADPSNASRTRARWVLLIAAALLIVAAVLAWRFTPLAEVVTPERLADWFRAARETPWSALVVIGIFIIGGFVVLPLSLLIAATALVFDAPTAFVLSMAGSLANGIATYAFGAHFVRGTFRQAFGPTVEKLARALDNRGILAVAVVRTMPIAPYTFVNVAAGSLGVRFSDYVIGTAIGLLPGVTLITAFGSQLRAVWEEPTVGRIAVIAGIIVAWLGLSLLLQKLTSRWRRKT